MSTDVSPVRQPRGGDLKEKEMFDLISLRFVDARRVQIRGYGYDEFAVFAELVQNAEDAYDSAGATRAS